MVQHHVPCNTSVRFQRKKAESFPPAGGEEAPSLTPAVLGSTEGWKHTTRFRDSQDQNLNVPVEAVLADRKRHLNEVKVCL